MAVNALFNSLKSVVLIPTALTSTLILISFTMGWNSATLILFWFVAAPVIAIRLPSLLSKNRKSIVEPIAGLILFYGLMVLMIYRHYESDYFKLMIISFLLNILLVSLIYFVKRTVSRETIAGII